MKAGNIKKHEIFYNYTVKAALKVWLKPYFSSNEIDALIFNCRQQWRSFWQTNKNKNGIETHLRFSLDVSKDNTLPWVEMKNNEGYAVCRICQHYDIDKIILQECKVIEETEEPINIYSLTLILFDNLTDDDSKKIKEAINKAHFNKFKKEINEIRIGFEIVPSFDFDQEYADMKLKQR